MASPSVNNCSHANISLPTTSDPDAVCADCGKILQNSSTPALTQTEKQSTFPAPAARCSRTNNQQGAMTMITAPFTVAVVVDADGAYDTHANVHFRGTVADCRAYAQDRRSVQVVAGCAVAAGSKIYHAELSYMLARKLWRDAFAFAVVPTQGRYSSGDVVRIVETASDLSTARVIASRLTKEYQSMMRPHGGSNGGYRVIAWGSTDSTIDGRTLDRTPDAK